MTTFGIIACGLLGFITAALLRIAIRRSSAIPPMTERLAPPLLLETLTAILCSALAWRIGAKPELLAYTWFTVFGVLLAAIDWRTRLLPTQLIWPSAAVLATLFGLAAALNDDWWPLARAGAAMVALLVFYGGLYAIRPGELGGGDLRLGAALGLTLGWAGWTTVAVGTLLGWLIAATYLTTLRIHLRGNAPYELPLAPFLIIGAIAGSVVSPTGWLN